jgi:hypothetical protein
MLEKDIEKRCVKFAENLGIKSIKLSAASNRGWPDRLFFICGKDLKPACWFVEFKRPTGELRKNQKAVSNFFIENEYLYSNISCFQLFKLELSKNLDKLKLSFYFQNESKFEKSKNILESYAG